jgi:uncharacterized protein
MTLRRLTPRDQPALEAFLRRHQTSSMFLLSNMHAVGIAEGDALYHGTYAGAFDGDTLNGVAAHYWNGNLLTQAPDLQDCAVLARAALAASGRPLRGIVGPAAQAEAIITAFGIADAAFQMRSRERLYTLSAKALTLPPHATDVRLASESDAPALVASYAAFGMEALHDAPDEAAKRAQEVVHRSIAAQTQWVLELDGSIVSSSTFNATVPPVKQIGGVYTPPALRGRGYARACVAGSLAHAFAHGDREAILFTGEENAAACSAYEAIGFRVVGDYFISLLKEPLLTS